MPEARRGPVTVNEVLLAELERLRPDAGELAELRAEARALDPDPQRSKRERARNLKAIFRAVGAWRRGGGTAPLAALCLSGGGIRSATFNLGVLQGLAYARLLDRFDYLSSVSGGGYIAGWLKAWMRRDGTASVIDQLCDTDPPNPLAPEPNPLDRLREHSNYLTPRLGLVSPDTWTAAAIVIRNLLLNWLVILPILGALVMLPQFAQLALHTGAPDALRPQLLTMSLAAAGIASYFVHYYRHPADGVVARSRRIVVGGLLPLVLAAALLAMAVSHTDLRDEPLPAVVAVAVLWAVGIPLFGWSLHEPKWHRLQGEDMPWRELAGLVASGAVGAAMMVGAGLWAGPWMVERPSVYVTLSVPILLAIYLFTRSLHVAVSSVELAGDARRGPTGCHPESGEEDAEREWWARFSGLVLLSALGWLAGSGLVLLGWHLAFRVAEEVMPPVLMALGGVSGVVVGVLGKSNDTGAPGAAARLGPRLKEWALRLAAPVFCVVLFVLLANATVAYGRWFTGSPDLFRTTPDMMGRDFSTTYADLALFLLAALALFGSGALMSRAVNVNRFSLHGFYRNRLVRAFLGASNPAREPDPFTGFDVDDNLRLSELWTEGPGPHCQRPLPVINCTLNLVTSQEKLAWQQRKAESFTMTPLYCGNFFEGYRPATEYGGPGGVTLGTALTVSGAAANPNMGMHSSPAMTFLMTLFNARLGAWLGNTNRHGDRSYRLAGPRWALFPLFSELFGLTHARSSFVNLSDGGHFDNLGLYEMVLRRCRFILVSDAGHDPVSGFGDLGSAIRKIRIDFGIPIEFTTKIQIPARDESEAATYCAVGEIHYAEVDGPGAAPGTLIYLKPALYGRGKFIPYDVFSYSRESGDFPHESTNDQWFSESQFESYRALGLHAFEQVTGELARVRGEEPATLEHLERAVRSYLETEEPGAPRQARKPRKPARGRKVPAPPRMVGDAADGQPAGTPPTPR